MKKIKTEKQQTVNEKSLIIAIDIGKTVHCGYFLSSKKRLVPSLGNNKLPE